MSEIVPKCEVKYNNEKYIIKSYDYDIQYFPFYNSRINQLKPILIECVHKKWGKESVIMSLDQIADRAKDNDNDLNEDNVDSVVIIGTLFKRMSLQPTILKELSEENQLLAQPVIHPNKYISSDDTLWLQDDDENIELFGNIDIASHCTGICLALKGRDDQNNTGFVVEDICYATNYIDVKIERPLLTKDQFVAIVSGLGFSKHMNQNLKLTKALNILIDLMNGNQMNEKFSQSKLISQLIIAGNCIGIEARKQESDSLIDKTPLWNRKVRAQTIHAVKLLDKFLERLGQTINIDVMPGELDPTTQLLPQQPLHPCLFDRAYNLASIKCVTNPHCAHYNGIHFLGTSGQNIKSIQEYSSLEDPIEIMKKTLEWLHIAPTTPDTLHSYPFTEFDPFVITEYPDVYFVGNQEKFNYATFDAPNGKKVLLISVPVFELEMICVLINLRSLNCEIIALN